MKLRLLQSMAGIEFSHNVGDEIEVNGADAIQRYVERGIAEIVEPAKKEKAREEITDLMAGGESMADLEEAISGTA